MQEFLFFIPEIYLLLTLAGLVFAEVAYRGERVRLVSSIALIGLCTAFVQVLFTYKGVGVKIFSGSVVVDGISIFFKLFLLALMALSVGVVHFSKEIREIRRTEFYVFLLASALAMCLVVSSADLLLIFIACQLMSIIGFFVAGYSKSEARSTEAAIKFLIFSGVSSVLFLFGIAILFAFTHTLNMYEIHSALASNPLPKETGLLVFVFVFLAICFFIGAFPMYLWMPDVLEGSPIPSSIYLGLGIPTAGLAIAIRFFLVVFGDPGSADLSNAPPFMVDWPKIVALASGATMLVGALLALRQQSAKRLLSALLISHLGFLLMGLLVLNRSGVAATLYCLLVDLFSLVGLYGVFSYFVDHLGSDRLEDLKGVLAKSVPECLCMILFFASFVGFPPLPGFIGRFALVDAVMKREWFGLVALAIGTSVISIAVFARFCFHLVGSFREIQPASLSFVPKQRAFLILLLVPVFLLALFAEPVLYWTGRSLELILG